MLSTVESIDFVKIYNFPHRYKGKVKPKGQGKHYLNTERFLEIKEDGHCNWNNIFLEIRDIKLFMYPFDLRFNLP